MNVIDSIQYEKFTSTILPKKTWMGFLTWWRKDEEPPRPTAAEAAEYSPCQPIPQLESYKLLLQQAAAIYVFRNGTAVFSAERLSREQAMELLRQYGPIEVGASSADYRVASIQSPVAGFVVRYAHPQIVSFKSHADYPPDMPIPLAGSMIRLGREMDAYDLTVVSEYSRPG